MYTVRTFNSILPQLRKYLMENRNGVVVESIKLKDINEFVVNMQICIEQLGIINSNNLNQPICIRRDKNTYTIIFITKKNMEKYINTKNICLIGEGIISFKEWMSKIK